MIKNALKEHTISLYNGNFFFQLGFSARNRKTETAQGPLGKSGFNKGLSAYNIFNRLEEWESGGHPATSCIKALAPPQRSGAAATPATPLPQSQPRQAHQAGGEHGIQLLPTPGLRKADTHLLSLCYCLPCISQMSGRDISLAGTKLHPNLHSKGVKKARFLPSMSSHSDKEQNGGRW